MTTTRRGSGRWPLLTTLIAAIWLGACTPAVPPAQPTAPATAVEARPAPTVAPTTAPRAAAEPATAAPATERATVRIGGSGGVIDRALFVGLAKGFYDEQGIDLDVQIFPTALDMIPLLATGRLDAMHGGSYPGIFNAVASGVDLKIVSNVSVFRQPGPGIKNSQWLVVRKDLADQIRSVADLKGRKVAIHS